MNTNIGKLTSLIKSINPETLGALKQKPSIVGSVFENQYPSDSLVTQVDTEQEEKTNKNINPEETKNLFQELEGLCSVETLENFLVTSLLEMGISPYSRNEKNDKLLNINGEIDELVQQKGTANCYMLTTLNALNSTPEGKEIISNLITHNEKNHTYTVNFPGVGLSYNFSATEIVNAENKNYEKVGSDGIRGQGDSWYSEGDDDVLLLEMAFEKFREEVKDGRYDKENWPDFVRSSSNYNKNKSALDNGSMSQFYYVLTGKETFFTENTENNPNAIHDTLDRIQDSERPYAIYASVNAKNGYEKDENGEYYIDYFKGNVIQKADNTTSAEEQRYSFKGGGLNDDNKITLNGTDAEGNNSSIQITANSDWGHALAITSVSEQTLTVINPWDSNKEITVNREEFEGYMSNVQYACLADNLNNKGNTKQKRVV